MDCENIDFFQFLEELLTSALRLYDCEYIPVSLQAGYKHFTSTSIIYSIIDTARCIMMAYDVHIRDILSTLNENDLCDVYINLLGRYFLVDCGFSWNKIRTFLGMVCILATVAYRYRMIFLSDDLLISTASFINSTFMCHFRGSRKWQAFEQDCIKTVLQKEYSNFMWELRPLDNIMQNLFDSTLHEIDLNTENSTTLKRRSDSSTFQNQWQDRNMTQQFANNPESTSIKSGVFKNSLFHQTSKYINMNCCKRYIGDDLLDSYEPCEMNEVEYLIGLSLRTISEIKHMPPMYSHST